MPNRPTQIIIHHTAVSYDKNPDQFAATKKYHKSLGWGDIGYHYEIAKNGKVYKGRGESTPGAHTKEKGTNYKSIGIALDGNFDTELPTDAQVTSLTNLLEDICARHDIPSNRIFPHRHYAVSRWTGKPYKSCPGNNIADSWGQQLVAGNNSVEKAFIKKWDGWHILDVEDKGKLYFVKDGKRFYVGGKVSQKFAGNKKYVMGFKHADVLRIPEG
jgi:N-acetyl-anhydromuramyl-L-alanine amidase AmpD